MTEVVENTDCERFQERDLRAKTATDADSIQHASNLLGHKTTETTDVVYRRKPTRVPALAIKALKND